MLVVKAKKSFFIPKVATVIKGRVFHSGSAKTEVGGADNSNAHSGFDIAKCG